MMLNCNLLLMSFRRKNKECRSTHNYFLLSLSLLLLSNPHRMALGRQANIIPPRTSVISASQRAFSYPTHPSFSEVAWRLV